MTLLKKVVEMEYIITINVNAFFIDANQNFVNAGYATGPFQVQQNDQRTMTTLFLNLLDQYEQRIPQVLQEVEPIKVQVLMCYDDQPGFEVVSDADMNLPVLQFMRTRMPSSRHSNRSHFVFILNIAARPVAAAAVAA